MPEVMFVILAILAMTLAVWDENNGFSLRWGRLCIAAIIIIVIVFVTTAKAQHVHPDEVITDARVAKFYEEWKRPPARAISCCSSKDCYAAPIRKAANGGIEYFHKWTQTWARIPASVLEHNQPDALDSPNHEAHICAAPYAPDLVFCAVLGSGT